MITLKSTMKSDDKRNALLVGSVGLGFAVFAVMKGDKKPGFAGSFKHATRDLKLSRPYFSSNAGLNYGIATAAASRTFLLDVGSRRKPSQRRSPPLVNDHAAIGDVGWELIVERDP